MFIWTGKERVTLRRAIEKYGERHQSLKLAEELGELQQALMKFMEYPEEPDRPIGLNELLERRDHLAEEIADVLIVVEQQVMMHDMGQNVALWKDIKMDRLREGL